MYQLVLNATNQCILLLMTGQYDQAVDSALL